MMKAAAQYSRDYLQDFHGEDPFMKSQQLTAIARIVFMQNHLLLETLLKHSPLAREHLEITENKIHIKNMQAFKDLSDIVNTQLSDDRYSATVNQRSKTKTGSLCKFPTLLNFGFLLPEDMLSLVSKSRRTLLGKNMN